MASSRKTSFTVTAFVVRHSGILEPSPLVSAAPDLSVGKAAVISQFK